MGWDNHNNTHCPCYQCEDRKPGTGCHDRCERFLAWKKKQDERNANERKMNGVDIMSDAKKKAIWRKKRYGRQGGRMSSRDTNN